MQAKKRARSTAIAAERGEGRACEVTRHPHAFGLVPDRALGLEIGGNFLAPMLLISEAVTNYMRASPEEIRKRGEVTRDQRDLIAIEHFAQFAPRLRGVNGRASRVGRERRDYRRALGNPAKNAALSNDHVEGGLMKARKIGAGGIRDDDTIIAAIIGFAKCCLDTDFCGHTADHQLTNAAVAEDRLEIGRVKGTFARLVDNRLVACRSKFVDDRVTGLAAHEQPPHRARIADGDLRLAARAFGRWQVGKIRPMSLAGVDHQHPRSPCRSTEAADRGDQAPKRIRIIAEHGTIAIGLEKIALHVNDQQCRAGGVEIERIGLGGDTGHSLCFSPDVSKGTARLTNALHDEGRQEMCQRDHALV